MKDYAEWPGGEWKTVRLIGKGGFGAVYEIQREEFGKVYKAAMKVMRIPTDRSEIQTMHDEGMTVEDISHYYTDYVKRLSDEIALLSTLKGYTNIVSYEDHKVIRDPDGVGWTILIRMELLKPVKQFLRENSYGEQLIVRLGTDICRALEICHEQNILHRDIKLDNIFVNERGDFELGDFGVARISENQASTMTMTGTPGFMAPEVYRKERYGKTADIYSLGIVLYMMMNMNRGPFYPTDRRISPEDREQALHDRINGKPIPEPLYGSPRLKKVVLKSIACRPEDRYQSAEEFRMALGGEEKINPMEKAYRNARLMADQASAWSEFQKAEAAFSILGDYKDSRRYAERCRMEAERRKNVVQEMPEYIPQMRNGADAEKETAYRQALYLEQRAGSMHACENAAAAFGALGDYKDSRMRMQRCSAEAARMRSNKSVEREPEVQNYVSVSLDEHKEAVKPKKKTGRRIGFVIAGIAVVGILIFVMGAIRNKQGQEESKAVETAEAAGTEENDGEDQLAALMKEAEAGDASAMNEIGLMYYNGDGVEMDHAESVEWFQKGAEAGNGDAMGNLGYAYEFGDGIEQDSEKAFEWYKKGAEAGSPWVMCNLGWMYENGKGTQQDYTLAAEWYEKAAEGGSARGDYSIGNLYYYGLGVKQSYEKAVEYYEEAAEGGYPAAMNDLGALYEDGIGVEQDYDKAAEWYMKGAKEGNSKAMENLGDLYYWGYGVEQDYEKSVEWYRKGAEAGEPGAMGSLGVAYEFGYGIEEDKEKAVEWYRKGAEAGEPWVMCNLAVMYEYGEGVEQNDDLALEWFLKAAEAGNSRAMYCLGNCYYAGDIVEQDYEQALEWYQKAVDAGYEDAEESLELVQRLIISGQ